MIGGAAAIHYDDEYVLKVFKNTDCQAIFDNVSSYCGIGINRRETKNDQTQGWTLEYQRPFYSVRINNFDEQTSLRREKFGYSLKVGFDVQATSARVKLALGIHMNDGVNQLFEAQDETMIGMDFEIIFP